eukprot:2067946-Rhodomonas_salina.2
MLAGHYHRTVPDTAGLYWAYRRLVPGVCYQAGSAVAHCEINGTNPHSRSKLYGDCVLLSLISPRTRCSTKPPRSSIRCSSSRLYRFPLS